MWDKAMVNRYAYILPTIIMLFMYTLFCACFVLLLTHRRLPLILFIATFCNAIYCLFFRRLQCHTFSVILSYLGHLKIMSSHSILRQSKYIKFMLWRFTISKSYVRQHVTIWTFLFVELSKSDVLNTDDMLLPPLNLSIHSCVTVDLP